MKLLVVAGEASSDLHLSLIIKQLKIKIPELSIFGVGGSHLRALGLHTIAQAEDMAVVGFTESIRKIPRAFSILNKLESFAKKEKPDLALLCDMPDFNLRLAPRLKAQNLPILYYISPKVWIWRKNRIHKIAKYIDQLLCIFPFEKDWYRENAPHYSNVSYVGNPIIEEIPNAPYTPKENQIALLPGSRFMELNSLLPSMLKTALALYKKNPKLYFVLPLAPTLRKNPQALHLLSLKGPLAKELSQLSNCLSIKEIPSHEVLFHSKLAIIASGTATLEAAVVGTPMIMIYQISAISEFLIRCITNYDKPLALANLINGGFETGKCVVPELVQNNMNPKKITSEAINLLENPQAWQAQVNFLQATRTILSTATNASPINNVVEHILPYQKC